MESVVRFDGVNRTFGAAVAAANVTFGVTRGEVFGLLGHNGAGKTTVIRLANGLLTPDSGMVQTFGADPISHGREIRRRTGVLTTYPGLDDYLSPMENLLVYAAIQGLDTSAASRRSAKLLAQLELDPADRSPARGLSAGLKQRVALARALVHDPELLFLDEPTANLDPVAARGVRDLVRDLAEEGRTVMLSTHNLAEAQELCDRVAILRRGSLTAIGSLDDLASANLASTVTEFRVAAGQVESAIATIRDLLPTRDVAIAGPTRLVVRGSDDADTATVIRGLTQADIDVHEVARRGASLEDVYMSMHLDAQAIA